MRMLVKVRLLLPFSDLFSGTDLVTFPPFIFLRRGVSYFFFSFSFFAKGYLPLYRQVVDGAISPSINWNFDCKTGVLFFNKESMQIRVFLIFDQSASSSAPCCWRYCWEIKRRFFNLSSSYRPIVLGAGCIVVEFGSLFFFLSLSLFAQPSVTPVHHSTQCPHSHDRSHRLLDPTRNVSTKNQKVTHMNTRQPFQLRALSFDNS